MILEILLLIPYKILEAILSRLPDLPAMPESVVYYAELFQEYLLTGMALAVKIYSAPLVHALLIISVASLTFTRFWVLFNWLYRKIIK